ncbi:hypothetical protein GH714_019296 [Hevea brasiliensis]|uniref:Uncharacterized protein n=1 Tax=Hevea brasiliensis TaxID=3981 RepID=A0A6A6N4M5_HEVBR|nr:hypothetical protein GH714_019296 [Hevea brasiliensis]
MYETKDNLVLSSRAFMKMCNLRFLNFSSVFNSGRGQVLLPSGFEFLPEELRYLYWDRYPLESLPPNFCPKNLVELHMPWSNLIQLWNRDKARFIALGNLKILNLKQCLELIRVPELSSVPNLEDLCLDGCSSLIEIPSSIGELKCLKELNLRYCSELHGIPQSICNLKSLTHLNMSNCLNVTDLPENIGDLEFLESLCISYSGIKALPSSINQLKNLASLQCSGCEGLTLPPLTEHEVEDRTITFLEFRNCINLDKEKVMEDVLETHLLKQEDLGNLRLLDLSDSSELTRVPDLSSVPNLEFLRLWGCLSLIEIPSSIGKLKCLKELDLSCCFKLHGIPQSICNLKSLTHLSMSNCLYDTELPENIGDLEFLESLCISYSGIKALPSSINQLKNLASLECSGCEGLTLPPLTALPPRQSLIRSESKLVVKIVNDVWEKLSCFSSSDSPIDNLVGLESPVMKAESLLSIESTDNKRVIEIWGMEKVMEDVLETHLLKHKIVEICIPRDEVPQTMRYKNQSGSSLSFTLDRPNLIGVSLCLVFDPKNHYGDGDVSPIPEEYSNNLLVFGLFPGLAFDLLLELQLGYSNPSTEVPAEVH